VNPARRPSWGPATLSVRHALPLDTGPRNVCRFSPEEVQGHTRHPRDPRPEGTANPAGDRGRKARPAIGLEHARRYAAQRNPGPGEMSRRPRCTSRKFRLRDDGEGRSEAIVQAVRYERFLSSSQVEIPRSRWRTADTSDAAVSHRRRSFPEASRASGPSEFRAASPMRRHVRRESFTAAEGTGPAPGRCTRPLSRSEPEPRTKTTSWMLAESHERPRDEEDRRLARARCFDSRSLQPERDPGRPTGWRPRPDSRSEAATIERRYSS